MATSSPLIGALRHRPWLTLWAGQATSQFGDAIYHLALLWWVVGQRGSGLDIALLLLCSQLPRMLLTPLGGLLADRMRRTQLMALCDAARAALMLLTGALALAGQLQLWQLYLIGALLGAARACFEPAYEAAVPALTPAALLAGANALRVIGYDTADIAGTFLGGLLLGATGPALLFLLNALSFIAGALCSTMAGRSAHEVQPARPEPHATPPLRAELAAGGRFVLATPWLLAGAVTCALLNMLQNAVIEVGLPLLAATGPGASARNLSLVLGAMAVGSLVTATLLGRNDLPARRLFAAFYGGCALSGAAMVALSVLNGLWAALPAAVYSGGLTLSIMAYNQALQLSVPDAIFGRVSAVDNLLSSLCLPLGYLLVGTLSAQLPAPALLGGAGLLSLTVTAVVALTPGARSMSRDKPGAHPAPSSADIVIA